MTLRLTSVLLVVWALVSFGITWFSRELTATIGGWPIAFFMSAQGSLVVYLVLVVVYAVAMDRIDRRFGLAEDGER